MIDGEKLSAVQAAINSAEEALFAAGRNLQFLLRPDGMLQIVRRTRTGQPAVVHEERLADLEGTDPVLWRAERPEGPVVLARPYHRPVFVDPDGLPRCPAPVELYRHGLPVEPQEVLDDAPLLVYLRALLVSMVKLLQDVHFAEMLGQMGPEAAKEQLKKALFATLLEELDPQDVLEALSSATRRNDEYES